MPVTLHTPDTIYAPRHVPSWLLLAAAAGTVNGVAFLTSQEFVTHVTGTVTRAGLDGPLDGFPFEYLAVLVSFLAGAAAAFVGIHARARAGGRDRWAVPLFAVAGVLAGVAVAGHLNAFGRFGQGVLTDRPPVVLLSLLGFAAGLQNASVACTTGMAVRTTHLTGPTTDLGLLLGAAWVGRGADRRAALAGAALRGGTLLAFLLGAAAAVPLTRAGGYLALLVPAGCVAAAGALSFRPDWSPSDFPFRPGAAEPVPDGVGVSLPADAKP